MKTIQLSTEQAKELYKKDNSLRNTLLHQFTDEELGIVKNTTFESLGYVEGFSIDGDCGVIFESCSFSGNENCKDIAPSEKDCKKYLAECQLKQIAIRYNDNQTEEEWIDWDNISQRKYFATYLNSENKILSDHCTLHHYGVIYFKRKEDLKKCIKENKQLFLDYFKI